MYSSARGIKSKVNSLKQILLNKPCEIIALCEIHLKQNEKVSIAGYKWIELNRKDKHAGEIGFLINNNIVKSCFVEPQTNEGIEIMTIRLELKQNKTIIICIYYGKRNQNKKQEMNLIIYHNIFQGIYRVTTTYRYLGILMLKLAMTNMG